uniref:Reverse transcriptase zinc-binding domain-containing protein n=1 Tax=Quercus lobata TaxID=97700 RepID=A0A7N2KUN3_QUELO
MTLYSGLLFNLECRYVVDDPQCPLCSQHEETVLHALWSCPKLAQVWNEDNQWSFKDMTFHDFPQLLLHVLNSECNVELFATQVWTVWFRRNKVRTTPPGFPLYLIAQRAYEALMEYRAAQQRTISTRSSVRLGARWSPPLDGWYKANFDAVTFQEDERAGIGVIWRDSKGLVMASASQNIQLMSSVVEMEALATI